MEKFLLTSRDVGSEKYTIEEIVEMMKPGHDTDVSSLFEFARLVTHTLEVDSRHEKSKQLYKADISQPSKASSSLNRENIKSIVKLPFLSV
jgi:hypothetical protein